MCKTICKLRPKGHCLPRYLSAKLDRGLYLNPWMRFIHSDRQDISNGKWNHKQKVHISIIIQPWIQCMFVVWSQIVLIVSMKTEMKLASFPKVLWDYWFGWDRAGSETNPDQSPRRDHQSVACIGGNPCTQEQRIFVTGNVPNLVILVCSILHTTNSGKNIWGPDRWWWVVSNPVFTTMMAPHQSHPFGFGEDFCFWACSV